MFQRIRDSLVAIENATLISLHPPSGKAYESDLIRFPVFEGEVRTRKRMHVDIIFAHSGSLYLLELKPASTQSAEDIRKLERLRDEVGLGEMLRIIGRRVDSSLTKKLEEVRSLVIGLGVGKHDSPTPPGFIVIETGKNVIAHVGLGVPKDAISAIPLACTRIISAETE